MKTSENHKEKGLEFFQFLPQIDPDE